MKTEIIKHVSNIDEIIVTCDSGMRLSLLNVGAAIHSWISPNGIELVARYQNIEDYLLNKMSFGATVGMNAGRIENGTFYLDGKKYDMSTEDNPHFLHSGTEQLARRHFEYEVLEEDGVTEVEFSHAYTHSVLPGTQQVKVTYRINQSGFRITYDVTSDETMLCNLTNHTYFNLDGDFTRRIDSHDLLVPASKVVLVDDEFIGRNIIGVEDTPFDFREMKAVMPVVDFFENIYPVVRGIDHYFPLDSDEVKLKSVKSNVLLSLRTSLPGVTVYTTNYPNDEPTQTGGPLGLHTAICLEPQFPANGINDPRFVPGIVKKDQPYHHFIDYRLEE